MATPSLKHWSLLVDVGWGLGFPDPRDLAKGSWGGHSLLEDVWKAPAPPTFC